MTPHFLALATELIGLLLAWCATWAMCEIAAFAGGGV